MRQAGSHRGAAARGDVPGEFQCGNRASHLEGKVDATARCLAYLRHTVRIGRVERVRGAERARQRELLRAEVDGHQRRGLEAPGTEQGRESHAAEAQHGHRRAARQRRGVDDRADAGEHRAAEHGRLLKRQVFRNPHAGFARHHSVLGKGGHAEVMVQRPAALQPALAGQQRAGDVRRQARLAQGRPAARAGLAVAAGGDEGGDDVVAGMQVGDARSHGLDDAGPLVAEHHGQWPRPIAVDHRQVGMA